MVTRYSSYNLVAREKGSILPDPFIVGFIAVVTITLVLFIEAERALYRRKIARTLFAAGLGFTVAGIGLVMVRYGVATAERISGRPVLYSYVNWMATVPDWFRLAVFAAAVILLVTAVALGLIGSLKGLAGSFTDRGPKRERERAPRRSAVVAKSKPARVRSINDKSGPSKKDGDPDSDGAKSGSGDTPETHDHHREKQRA